MTYTPEQRRKKLCGLIAQDRDCAKLEKEYWTEHEKFARFTDKLPRWIRERLLGYPTLCYDYHQRIITLLCEELRFPEEDGGEPAG